MATGSLLNLLPSAQNPIYTEERFTLLIDTHRAWLKSQPDTLIHPVDLGLANKFNNDLISYLLKQRVPREVHYAVLRVNDFTSPTDFTIATQSLIIPSIKAIGKLRSLYMTSRQQLD